MDGLGILFGCLLIVHAKAFLVDDAPFRNTKLSWEERVEDLVKRLTPQEIADQMLHGGTDASPAITRLGIPRYSWDTECLRGDAFAGEATGFPQAIGLAAAWNPRLIREVAEAISVEVHAKYNDYVKRNQYGMYKGISCFSPVINIMKHPLWGRNQETYGEDPYLSGVYAQNYIWGLQGNHSRYIRTNAGCKHFAVHAGPEDNPVSRFGFDAKVSERDLHVTFLPQFRMCVQAGTYSIMCSYNRINGVPACANKKLLTDILRKKWGFQGYVISDQEALENIIGWHKYINNNVDTAAACVNAGCNLELFGPYPNAPQPVYTAIYEAFKQGKISEATLRERVKPLFMTRMRLGDFDPKSMNPYSKLDLSVVQSQPHRSLAVKAAIESIVLLKNVNGFLPLPKKHYRKIAIVGPMANNRNQQFGDYTPDVDARFTSTPFTSLKTLADIGSLGQGCSDNRCTQYNQGEVLDSMKNSEIVVVCLGTGVDIETESKDRRDLNLPGNQLRILQDVVTHSNGAPVILLLFTGGPIDISWAESNPSVKAIIQCSFSAEGTGEALRKVLIFESNVGPAGRLPYTWYKSLNQLGSMTDYSMTGKTYRYFTGEPLYSFGYGLSYSTFRYSDLRVQHSTLHAGDKQTVTVKVTNTGNRVCDEVVQVYISRRNPSQAMPHLQLSGFDRVEGLQPHSSRIVNFDLYQDHLAVWHDDRGFVIEPGRIDVYVGGQQPNQHKKGNSNVLQSTFTITGTKVLGKH
ncbi:uncharacterized protein LOC135482379 [Liolophura sinensis]|uniref:uncharacterized protein LOC135482379 n=1 Tax=Liolophura sinensis TaxID=3198878 RepID=UPI0031593262